MGTALAACRRLNVLPARCSRARPHFPSRCRRSNQTAFNTPDLDVRVMTIDSPSAEARRSIFPRPAFRSKPRVPEGCRLASPVGHRAPVCPSGRIWRRSPSSNRSSPSSCSFRLFGHFDRSAPPSLGTARRRTLRRRAAAAAGAPSPLASSERRPLLLACR
jgi:hypothetical protein